MLIPAKSYKGAYRCGCASHVIGHPAVIGLGLAGSLLVRSDGWLRGGALAWLCARSAVCSFACPFVSADALLFARLRGRRPPAASQPEILWFWYFLFVIYHKVLSMGILLCRVSRIHTRSRPTQTGFQMRPSSLSGPPTLSGFPSAPSTDSGSDRLHSLEQRFHIRPLAPCRFSRIHVGAPA